MINKTVHGCKTQTNFSLFRPTFCPKNSFFSDKIVIPPTVASPLVPAYNEI